MKTELSLAAQAEINGTLKVLGDGFVFNMFSWYLVSGNTLR